MSFFKNLIDEVQREINAATAEFRDDVQKSIPRGTQKRPARQTPQASHARHGSQGLSATPTFSGEQQGVNPGVIQHQSNAPVQANRNVATAQQRPPQAKKRRKKAPQQAAATQPQTVQVKKASFVHPHKLVANLTPAVARSSIIMSEVLGPPLAKRHNKRGWH